MKRSPMPKRKKPMKRTGFKKKEYIWGDGLVEVRINKRIRPVSKKKSFWNRLYAAKHKADASSQKCAKCNLPDHKEYMERHHPYGRVGARIMEYIYLCCFCHEMIHAEAKQARALGWLQPAFDGRPPDPKVPKPWL